MLTHQNNQLLNVFQLFNKGDENIIQQQLNIIKTLINQNQYHMILEKIPWFSFIDKMILLQHKSIFETNDNIVKTSFCSELYLHCLKFKFNETLDQIYCPMLINESIIETACLYNNLHHIDYYRKQFPRYTRCLELCWSFIDKNFPIPTYYSKWNTLDLLQIWNLNYLSKTYVQNKVLFQVFDFFFQHHFIDDHQMFLTMIKNKKISNELSSYSFILILQSYLKHNHEPHLCIDELMISFQSILSDDHDIDKLNIDFDLWYNFLWKQQDKLSKYFPTLYFNITSYIFSHKFPQHFLCQDIIKQIQQNMYPTYTSSYIISSKIKI